MDLLGKVPNLALILLLPSTSSVNLGEHSREGVGQGRVLKAGGSLSEVLAGGTWHSASAAGSSWREAGAGSLARAGGRGCAQPASAYLGAGEGSSAVSWSASKRSSGRKAGGSLLRSTRGWPAWLQRLSGAPSFCTADHKESGLERGRQRVSAVTGPQGAIKS